MFERFTDQARRVLVMAQEEARLLDHNFIGTEHLLLGMIDEHEGIAAQALVSLGIDLVALRDNVEQAVGPHGSSNDGSPPFTPRAKKVLELSLRESLRLGHNYIGTEHLLLGLTREGEGVGVRVLRAAGVEPDAVSQRVLQLLGVASEAEVPEGDVRASVTHVPRCARCGKQLDLLFRDMDARPDEPTSSSGSRRVSVVYCRHCGTPLATFDAGPATP